eukprot:TRINITY_DN2641_c0_g1_i3.p1 TRINITY_DN2641_c0_g1~~TRINITY_DN2641_c0_g1_i3.p1  ORF type:complete len:601 (+),score=187.45 TRINITY_DN2641_c0_g1_i3:218-1804(+)
MKRKKEKMLELKPMSLADSGSEDDDLESWLATSKSKISENVKAKRIQEQLESMYEDEDQEHEFSNVRVMHDFEDIQEGKSMILTLADTDMTEDDKGFDSLISNELKEKETIAKNNEIRKGKPKYNKYSGEKEDILPQYADEEGPKEFHLDFSGNIQTPDGPTIDPMELEKQKNVQNANMELKLASDTYTRQEMLQFKKKKKPATKKKRRKKKAKLASELKSIGNEGDEDFASREDRIERRKQVQLKEVVDILKKRQRYSEAVKSVTVKADDNDEDEELYESLKKARNLAGTEKQNWAENVVKRAVKRNRVKEEDSEEDGVIFSEKSVFVNQFPTNIKTEDEEMEDLRPRKKRKLENPLDVVKMELEEGEADEDATDILGAEANVGKGLASTLDYLKQRKDNLDGATKSGRLWDELIETDPEDRIKLEYLDEYGRPMTQKEAFRRMSYKFHGRLPGKNKQAKRLDKFKREMRRQHMDISDTPLNTVNAMHKQQEKTGLAYVVVQGDTNKILSERKRKTTEKKKKEQRNN